MMGRVFYVSPWIVALLALLCSLQYQRGVRAFGPNPNQKRHTSPTAGNNTPSSGNGSKNKDKKNVNVDNTHNDVDSFIGSGTITTGTKSTEKGGHSRIRQNTRASSSSLSSSSSSSFALKCSPADDMSWDPLSAPKLDFDEDFYAVLEVEITASAKELKKAYYKMVFKYHPDNRKDASDDEKKLCNQQMMVINNAYRILKEDDVRKKYDLQRKRGVYGNKAVKMPRGNGSGATSSSTSTRSADRTQRRTTYSTSYDEDNDVDDMGWSRKNQRRYNSWADRDVDADAQRWAEEEEKDYEEGMFDDLDDFVNEGWFDEEMKAKLKARRRRQAREQNPTAAAARSRDGSGSAGGSQSIFEEIKDLLKEEERSKSSRRETQRKDVEREQKYYARSSDGDVSSNPNSPVNKVRRELQRLQMKVASDQRDWGEVVDQELIEERLNDLYEIKQLQSRLEELLQQEGKTAAGNDSYYGDNDGFNGGGSNDNYYDDYESSDGGRRPRPQRQRASSSSGSSGRGYAAGFDDDEGSGDAVEDEIEDRLYQRYRRRRAAEQQSGRDGDTSVENEMRRLRGL